VVVDAGHTPSATLQELAAAYPHAINYHRRFRPQSLARAWSWAVRRCIGDIVLLLRPGDIWHEGKLARYWDAFAATACDWLAGPGDDYGSWAFRRSALDGLSFRVDRAGGGLTLAGAAAHSLRKERVSRSLSHTASRRQTREPAWLTARRKSRETDEPTVSIIIPCYGRTDQLKDTLWSCLEQDYPPLEVLLVDDASDPPLEPPFAAPHVRVIREPRNRGPSAARNLGIDAAASEYIKPLDSDDLFLHRHALGQFLQAAVEHEADIVYADALMVNLATNRIGCPFGGEVNDLIFADNFLSPSQLLVRRRVFDDVRFPEHIRYSEDWTFLMQAYWLGKFRFQRIDEPLTIYRLTADSVSTGWRGAFQWYSQRLDERREQLLRLRRLQHLRPGKTPP
jgi:hypothetical protein